MAAPPDVDVYQPALVTALRKAWRGLDGPPGPRGYWWTRFAILRLLGFVYAVAFATAVFQLIPLVGEHGLLPAGAYLDQVSAVTGGREEGWSRLPTLFWWDASDDALLTVSVVGLVVSLAVMFGLTNAGALLALWCLYLSIDHVGQRWYAFGWESQLLETGFLAMFLAPWKGFRPLDPRHPPSRVPIILMRWLIVRIMLGAGLIKLRGDPCWVELTCLEHHFETQPIPNPLSPLLHHGPRWMLRGGVAFNHFVELVVPFLAFGPRRARHFAGIAFVAFQGFLIVSGNLSFLNWLTIVPVLACFDDGVWERLIVKRWRERWRTDPAAQAPRATRIATYVYAALVAYLSLDIVANLLGLGGQSMNRSYDRLHLVNTYGAFGTVGKTRPELIIEGTLDPRPGPNTRWQAYEFKCKPGDPDRRPCIISPYHYRLDWLIWFAAMEAERTHALYREDWVVRLVAKLLEADPAILSLLARDPFAGQTPRFIRVELYQYRFAPPGSPAWWTREKVGTLIRPVERTDLQP